jgi:hypothetical protein
MQASALETKLPRALVRKNAELMERHGGLVNQKPEPDPAPAAQAASTTAEPPAPPSADPRENDPAYWKQRFTVTSGILRSEREDRKAQTLALNQRISELETELQSARSAAPSSDGDLGEFFTPEQIEEMGEPAAWATYRAIKKQVQTQVTEALKPITAKAKATEEDEQKGRATAFRDKLAELVPDYTEIDESEEWGEWLAEETDDGITRQVVLNKHCTALNAQRVAKMFQDFKKTQERPTPPVQPHGKAATPPGAPPKDTHLTPPTSAEIKEFYKRAKLSKVSPQEVATFEKRMALRNP